jgi:CubicO group peptidase (beta-lactamase class C family)
MRLFNELGRALAEAGSMTWQITWSLILGFTLSAVLQAVVRREAIARHLGNSNTKTLALATGLGAASSSCSYAAVALARALVRRGASFTAAMAFEIASTNLVIELGIILALLLSWQFTLAEFVGGPIMIVLMAVAFRLFVRQRTITAAREQADKGLAGSMEGHAAMDMSIQSGGRFWQRLISRDGYTSVSNIFVDGMGRRHPRHRDRSADRRGGRRLGPRQLLAAAVPDRPPAGGPAVGAGHRTGHLAAQLRMLDRQRAVGHRHRHHLELHHHPQHHLPAAGRGTCHMVLPLRRRPDAQDDGRQPRRAATHARPL